MMATWVTVAAWLAATVRTSLTCWLGTSRSKELSNRHWQSHRRPGKEILEAYDLTGSLRAASQRAMSSGAENQRSAWAKGSEPADA